MKKYTDTVTHQYNNETPFTLTYYHIQLRITNRENPIIIDSLDPTLYNELNVGQNVFYWNGTVYT